MKQWLGIYKAYILMIKKITSFLNRLNESKDGRALVSNTAYLFLLQVSGFIFPLLTIPYLARVIGVEGFGKIAFAAGVMIWLTTISDWGFNYTATRDVAKNKSSPEKVSEIFSNILWARCLLASVSFIFLLTLIAIVPYFRENSSILLVSFLMIPGNIFFPQWFFQALERMQFITIFSLVSKIIFTASVFIFIKEESDFILQPLFISLGNIVCGIAAMYVILRKWHIKLSYPNYQTIISAIKSSTDVFINNLMPNLYNSLGIVLLGLWWGTSANGIYDAGKKLIAIMHSFMDIIVKVTFPFLSRKIEAHNLFARVYLSASILLSLLAFLISPIFIKFFYTDAFDDALIVMRISSISIFLVAVSKVYGTNYLIIEGHEKILRNITIRSSLISFIISLPLIYFYGYIGAAITLVLAQFLIGASTARSAIKIKKLKTI